MQKMLALIVLLTASPALADTPPKALRLMGSAPAAAEGAPRAFVVDAMISEGDGPLQTKVEGWLAGLDPVGDGAPVHGKIEGACVEERCALSADLGDRKLLLSGDLIGPSGGPAKARFQDYDDKDVWQGAVTLTPFAEDVPGLGRLLAPGSIKGRDLSEALMWAGFSSGNTDTGDDPPGDYERKSLSDWQASTDRPPTGLIFAADLVALNVQAEKAKVDAGWTPVPGMGGWKAGYPARKLIPSLTTTPNERRYASPDGKAILLVRTDPPMDGEAWDAFVDTQTSRKTHGYARMNDDFELNYTEGDRTTIAYYFHGAKGVRRMEFSYPTADDDAWSSWGPILQYAYRAGEDER